MFSATFPAAMQEIAKKYMREYVFVAVGRIGSTTDSITQELVMVKRNDKRLKLETLCNVLTTKPAERAAEKVIVFTQKKVRTGMITLNALIAVGLNLHQSFRHHRSMWPSGCVDSSAAI